MKKGAKMGDRDPREFADFARMAEALAAPLIDPPTPRDCARGVHVARFGEACACGDPGPALARPSGVTLGPAPGKPWAGVEVKGTVK